ncbi:ATP-dependent sacrificial sulfur transferase LarE [uncultured Propionibacterium sp.]|uniref:ATP-dependent sacrificial sulfur transferase LarE n=1 Tax=uncultured Propionibacterium sp. TaxID=218066 RepID=UPI00292CD745|nr:ATP-dependent sacrificial sulfur transferase LarE [uncultured Propionibacterium sp.]
MSDVRAAPRDGADEAGDRLIEHLRRALPTGRLGVAYSGGVDSALLSAAAVRALGLRRVVALLAVSDSLAARERRTAHATAESIGVSLVEIVTHEGEVAGYAGNGADRCFFCKNELFTVIDEQIAGEHRLAAVAYGENADDGLRPDRPGARAATNHRVLRPLAEVGLTKAQVRALTRAWGVPVADKPAAPCLASRIPHGQRVTAEKLHQIDAAEDVVLAEGFGDVRVRHHGPVARIEVPADELGRLADAGLRGRIIDGVRAAGFRFVMLDLAGIQSGAFTLPLVTVEHYD